MKFECLEFVFDNSYRYSRVSLESRIGFMTRCCLLKIERYVRTFSAQIFYLKVEKNARGRRSKARGADEWGTHGIGGKGRKHKRKRGERMRRERTGRRERRRSERKKQGLRRSERKKRRLRRSERKKKEKFRSRRRTREKKRWQRKENALKKRRKRIQCKKWHGGETLGGSVRTADQISRRREAVDERGEQPEGQPNRLAMTAGSKRPGAQPKRQTTDAFELKELVTKDELFFTDIVANGILNAFVQDKCTGKSNQITISTRRDICLRTQHPVVLYASDHWDCYSKILSSCSSIPQVFSRRESHLAKQQGWTLLSMPRTWPCVMWLVVPWRWKFVRPWCRCRNQVTRGRSASRSCWSCLRCARKPLCRCIRKAGLCDRRDVEGQTSIPSCYERSDFWWHRLALQALALQAFIASPPTCASWNPNRRRGAEEHVNSAGAKEAASVQYARVDGALPGGAPPPVRRDARGPCEQQRRVKPAARTAPVESQPPVLRPLEFTKLWSCRRMYRVSKLSQIKSRAWSRRRGTYPGERGRSSTKDSGIQGPPSTTRRRDQEEGPCGPGRGSKSWPAPAWAYRTPWAESAAFCSRTCSTRWIQWRWRVRKAAPRWRRCWSCTQRSSTSSLSDWRRSTTSRERAGRGCGRWRSRRLCLRRWGPRSRRLRGGRRKTGPGWRRVLRLRHSTRRMGTSWRASWMAQEDERGADGDGEDDEMDGHSGRVGQKRGRR